MEKRLEHMKESLMACVEMQLTHLEDVDTKELGEAIDMIKDLEEAIYYCTVTKAMKEYDGDDDEKHHYQQKKYPMRDMDRNMGKMYYDGRMYSENPQYMGGNDERRQYSNGNGNGNSSTSTGNGNGSSRQYGEREYNLMRDMREGRSPNSRRMYMEHKETHADKVVQMRELENYMQELSQDIVEMIEGASPEEKQYMSKKIAALATKIQ